jgi:hypothetical protein
VDIVKKGANMSYRAAVFSRVRFDTQLRGTGARSDTKTWMAPAAWQFVSDASGTLC